MSPRPTPEAGVFVAGFTIALFAFGLGLLAEIGRRVERRVGPDALRPLSRASPGAVIFQGMSLYMNQPGKRAKVRNVCFTVGAVALIVCVIAIAVGVNHHAR